ncbi:hypothetical protein CENSYa_0217 [Cenarchaeum symbiosum A]|uniref:Uncharacterized protein n=1 Tax=Cenarchaeum symbiosum (strain A) TaxID=414004 RepID=A0RU43_CENSY|nr:hypothetical protein CENSYa_0217 [Cenarchaeum symbiosum A]
MRLNIQSWSVQARYQRARSSQVPICQRIHRTAGHRIQLWNGTMCGSWDGAVHLMGCDAYRERRHGFQASRHDRLPAVPNHSIADHARPMQDQGRTLRFDMPPARYYLNSGGFIP